MPYKGSPLTLELGETRTDAEGCAVLPLPLDKLRGGTLRCRLLVEGFEPGGGRAVTEEKEFLVSPLGCVLGFRPTGAAGNLDFIPEGSEAALEFVALGPDLAPRRSRRTVVPGVGEALRDVARHGQGRPLPLRGYARGQRDCRIARGLRPQRAGPLERSYRNVRRISAGSAQQPGACHGFRALHRGRQRRSAPCRALRASFRLFAHASGEHFERFRRTHPGVYFLALRRRGPHHAGARQRGGVALVPCACRRQRAGNRDSARLRGPRLRERVAGALALFAGRLHESLRVCRVSRFRECGAARHAPSRGNAPRAGAARKRHSGDGGIRPGRAGAAFCRGRRRAQADRLPHARSAALSAERQGAGSGNASDV